ncbi:deoxyuridine 5'-triphosphate nucleotidohydrolase [bacterium]|nr:deoxyuridine 5'-triphosphate nucleotidohydrolase [bacterium]
MIIPPQTLSFPGAPAPDLQLQQAGFDLTLAKVERIREHAALRPNPACLDMDNSARVLPETVELGWNDDGAVLLGPDGGESSRAYLLTYNETISVPADCAGIVLPRSSLMRCGSVLHSALWDPGYSGKGQGLLVVFHPIRLLRNARIAQFVLWRMEQAAARLYDGQYQGENLQPPS